MAERGPFRLLVPLLLAALLWALPAHAGEKVVRNPQAAPAAVEEGEDLRAEALPWLDLSPTVVSLRGYVVRKRFYGPPGYGETPKEDYKINAWLLVLDEPINIRGDETNDEDRTLNVRRVQLVIIKDDKRLWKRMGDLLGQEVYATGMLYHGNTGWYWTSTALELESIGPVPRGTCDSECRR